MHDKCANDQLANCTTSQLRDWVNCNNMGDYKAVEHASSFGFSL